MLAVELCAGAGGLSSGFVSSGIDIAVAVERDRHYATTYRFNFPKVDLIQDDIACVSGRDILSKLNLRKGQLGALVAGLPCQGFSESNRRTRTASNPRNQLYRQVLRLLSEIEPRWFVIENVAGLTTLESGRFLKRMLDEFGRSGYRVKYSILNASDFGVPQFRRRTFLVGTRTVSNFEFPEPNGGRQPTVRDAIADLPILRNGADTDLLNYRRTWSQASTYVQGLRSRDAEVVSGNQVSRNSNKVIERYKYIQMNQNWRAIPACMMKNYKNRDSCHTGIYHRLSWNEQSKVIGNFRKNMLIHPSQNRGLSVREAARLQSFPDSHEFVGPLNHRQQQVGDAVPPCLAQVIGYALQASDLG